MASRQATSSSARSTTRPAKRASESSARSCVDAQPMRCNNATSTRSNVNKCLVFQRNTPIIQTTGSRPCWFGKTKSRTSTIRKAQCIALGQLVRRATSRRHAFEPASVRAECNDPLPARCPPRRRRAASRPPTSASSTARPTSTSWCRSSTSGPGRSTSPPAPTTGCRKRSTCRATSRPGRIRTA